MKILINEKTDEKLHKVFQRFIDKELLEIKTRYREEEISAKNWYLSTFSHINDVDVVNIKYEPGFSVFIDVYADLNFDEDDVQTFANYLREKLNYAGNPWIVPKLFNNKKSINEDIKRDKIEKIRGKIIDSVDRFGLLTTIKMFGGIEKFKLMVPDYFKYSDNKIELINDLIKYDTEAEGRVYLYEIIDLDNTVVISVEKLNDGRTIQHELDYVQEDILGITSWEVNENGDISDDPWNTDEYDLDGISKSMLNKVFSIMVKHYLI